MRGLRLWMLDEGLHAGTCPAELELDLTCRDVRIGRGALRSTTVDVLLLRDGASVGFGVGELSIMTPATYRRLRPARGTELWSDDDPAATGSPPARAVGRRDPADVLLRPVGPKRWRLHIDTRHPVLFDHPCDHVPGMVLIEASRQVFQVTTGKAPTQLAAVFERYVELGPPVHLEMDSGRSGHDLVVHVEQDRRAAATLVLGSCSGTGEI
jgi:hypothetical protein